MNTVGKQVSIVTISVKSNKRANQLVSKGIRIGEKKLRVKRCINSRPDTICGKCSTWRHTKHKCIGTRAKCPIYLENHTKYKHRCSQPGYRATVEVYCRSIVVRYLNCKRAYRATNNRYKISREVRAKCRKTGDSIE